MKMNRNRVDVGCSKIRKSSRDGAGSSGGRWSEQQHRWVEWRDDRGDSAGKRNGGGKMQK